MTYWLRIRAACPPTHGTTLIYRNLLRIIKSIIESNGIAHHHIPASLRKSKPARDMLFLSLFASHLLSGSAQHPERRMQLQAPPQPTKDLLQCTWLNLTSQYQSNHSFIVYCSCDHTHHDVRARPCAGKQAPTIATFQFKGKTRGFRTQYIDNQIKFKMNLNRQKIILKNLLKIF